MQAWLKIRRNQLLLLIIVLVGGAAGFFLMTHGGSSTSPTALPSAPAPAPGTVPSPQPSQGSGHHGSPKSVLVLTGRNPFQCIECPTPAPTSSASPGAQQNTQSLATNASGMSVSGHAVTLHGTFTRAGQIHVKVTVDGVTYVPAVGETFAGHFQLASAGGGCARFLYGDAAFTLCMAS